MKRVSMILVCFAFLLELISFANIVSANIYFHQDFDSESNPYPGTSCMGVDDLYSNLKNNDWYSYCTEELRTDVNDRSSPSSGSGHQFLTFACDWVSCDVRENSQRANANIGQPSTWGASSPACADGGDYDDGTEYWVGMSYYIPVDNNFNEGGGVMMFQFLGAGSEHNIRLSTPSVAYGSVSNFQIGYRQNDGVVWGKDSGISMKSTEGTWLDVVVQWVPYTYDTANAIVRMWINGQNVLDKSGKQTFKTPSGGPWFQFLLYNKGCYDQFDCLTNCKDEDTGAVDDWRVLRFDELRFTDNTKGTKSYCDVAPPIWAAKPTITYPSNSATNVPSPFTATYSGYSDHRSDPQNCFAYTKTEIQIDERGGDWSTPVYDSGEINAQTSNHITGLATSQQYQMRVREKSVRSGTSDSYWGDWSDTNFFTVGINQIPQNQTDPIAYWNFDEGTGTIAHDSSGNNNYGTLVNGPTWTTGRVGSHALSLDGIDDYISVPDSASLNSNYLTTSLWFKADSLEDNTGLIAKGDSSGRQYWEWIYQDGLSLEIDQGGHANYLFSLQTGRWYNLAVTYDGSNIIVYINGNEVNRISQSTGTILIDDDPFYIGKLPGFVSFDGLIDEVRIYNYALSESEIMELYSQEKDSCSKSGPDGVSIEELIDYIAGWKSGSVSIEDLLNIIGKWKSGAGCHG